MAGSYPDAPFRRMAWDEDGTIFWWADSTAGNRAVPPYASIVLPGTEASVARKGKFNNEATLTSADWIQLNSTLIEVGGTAMYMIFPELRDIYGMNYWSMFGSLSGDYTDVSKPWDLQYSGDTHNGIDGTWIPIYAAQTYPVGSPYLLYSWDHWYRVGIVTTGFPLTGVRAIRWHQYLREVHGGTPSNWDHIHLYGDKTTGATPDRLLFIDQDTGLEFTEPLDWGDVPRGTTLTHDIKVMNNSATLTANTILLDFEALTGLSDTWHTIKETGGAYGNTLSITSIAPTASYPSGADVLTIRLIVGDAENLGLQACRLQASTASWS